MSKLLKSKYNITGDRCVDACLSYGELRYLDKEGVPINIEVPYDKYGEAITDFTERRKEGLVNCSIDPATLIKMGSFTYNQVKNIANLNKIKGLRYFSIDGSIELEHTLGISGSIEYALAIWNGNTKEEALEKAIFRAMKIHGLKFIKSLNIDEKYMISNEKISQLCNTVASSLYITRPCKIEDEIYSNIVDLKINFKNGSDIIIGATGSLIGLILVQGLTNFGTILNNISLNLGISLVTMMLSYVFSIKLIKSLSYRHIKKSNVSIVEMFNDELEYYSFSNTLTEEENNTMIQNIINREISKLIIEIKSSVNKKISINKVISKETQLLLESRSSIFLPNDEDIKEMTEAILNRYFNRI